MLNQEQMLSGHRCHDEDYSAYMVLTIFIFVVFSFYHISNDVTS